MQHLKRVLPMMIEAASYEWVLILLDDVNATRLSLPRLIRIARHNQLSWASPAVHYAHDKVMTPHDTARLRELGAPPAAVGRVVRRIESFAWLMTPPMYRCLHTLIDTALNAIGWGYDHWLFLYCRGWPSVRFKAGVVDALTVTHGLISSSSAVPASATTTASSSTTMTAAGGAAAARPRRTAAVEAMLTHTYGRKEASEQKDAMIGDFARRGLPPLHAVDKQPHGWLMDAPSEPSAALPAVR